MTFFIENCQLFFGKFRYFLTAKKWRGAYLEHQRHLDPYEHTSYAPSIARHSYTTCYTGDNSWDLDHQPETDAKHFIIIFCLIS